MRTPYPLVLDKQYIHDYDDTPTKYAIFTQKMAILFKYALPVGSG